MQKWKIRFGRSRSAVAGKTMLTLLGLLAMPGVGLAVPIGMYITEFNSSNASGTNEFVEFTNLGPTNVDMTGWSEDDSNRTPNKAGHSLSGFGIVKPGESVIFTENTPAAFKTYWFDGTAPLNAYGEPLKVIGPYTNDNLSGTSDEVNLYNAASALVDRLTYPDGVAGGTANGVTRNPSSTSALGAGVSNASANQLWQNSFIGDPFNSFHAANDNALIGNPGIYTPALSLVPEPTTLTLVV